MPRSATVRQSHQAITDNDALPACQVHTRSSDTSTCVSCCAFCTASPAAESRCIHSATAARCCRQDKEGSNVTVSLFKSRQLFTFNKSDYILGLAVKACDLAQLYNYSGFNSHVIPGRSTQMVKHKRSVLHWITRRQWLGDLSFCQPDVSLAYILLCQVFVSFLLFYIHDIRIGKFFLATLKSLKSLSSSQSPPASTGTK
jgi:hypothetical protein